MKKILITGASGFLGSRLAHYFKDKYMLLVPSHSELNVSREEAVMAYMSEHLPDIVLHCAALSNTWYCQQHPDDSHKVNVQGTVKLAKACKQTGAKLIFMSSDQVYNGTALSGPLKEYDVQQPVNVYGMHKLEAEQRAMRNYPLAVGLRLTWMYDVPASKFKLNSNILQNIQRAVNDVSLIQPATHEYRGITHVWDVVRQMEKAFLLPGGIYNFGSAGSLNSYELHLQVAHMMGIKAPQEYIQPDEERFSMQERNLCMDCSLAEEFGIHFPSSIDGIEKALNSPVW